LESFKIINLIIMIAPTPTIIGGVGAGLAVATQAEEVEVVAGRPPGLSSLGEADQLYAIIVESPGTNPMCVSHLALSVSPRSTWQHVAQRIPCLAHTNPHLALTTMASRPKLTMSHQLRRRSLRPISLSPIFPRRCLSSLLTWSLPT